MTVPPYVNTDQSYMVGAAPAAGYNTTYSAGFQGEQFPVDSCADPSIQTLNGNSQPGTSAVQPIVANTPYTVHVPRVLGSGSPMAAQWGQPCQWNQVQISVQQESGNQGEGEFNFPRGSGLVASQGNTIGASPSLEGRYQACSVGDADDPSRGPTSAHHWAEQSRLFYPVAQQQHYPLSAVNSEASRASSTGALGSGNGEQSTLQPSQQSNKGGSTIKRTFVGELFLNPGHHFGCFLFRAAAPRDCGICTAMFSFRGGTSAYGASIDTARDGCIRGVCGLQDHSVWVPSTLDNTVSMMGNIVYQLDSSASNAVCPISGFG